MNGHIKSNGIASNGCGDDDDDGGLSGFFHFKLPLLRLKETDEQVDFLLLAWALLLHRGSIESGDGEVAFNYGPYLLVNGDSLPSLGTIALLGEVISGEDDHISKILEAIRAIRQKRYSKNGNPRGPDGQNMYFATANPAAENLSNVCCPADIAFVQTLADKSPARSVPLA